MFSTKMRKIILLSVVLTVLQMVNVSTAASGVPTKSTRMTASVNSGKFSPSGTKLTQKRLPQLSAVGVDGDEDGDVTEDGAEEQFQVGGRRANSKTVAGVAGKRVNGANDSAADPPNVSIGQLARLLGSFVRDQLTKNAVRVAEFKAGLLSGLGSGLIGCLLNALTNAQDLGGKGAQVVSGALQGATVVGETALRAALATPLKVASPALNAAKRGAAALPGTVKTLSNAAFGVLPVVGVNSDETDVREDQQQQTPRAIDAEEDDDITPPPPTLKTKRVVSRRVK